MAVLRNLEAVIFLLSNRQRINVLKRACENLLRYSRVKGIFALPPHF